MVERERDDSPMLKGAFVDALKRTNKEVKSDRAEAIAEEAEVGYRRYIEDLKAKLRKLQRDRRQTLDLSPENAQSLILAKNFDAIDFVQRDVATGINIRKLRIEIEIAEERYSYLFGGDTEEKKEETAVAEA